MIKRGEIYYIEPSKTIQVTGSEQRANRPGIIVSCDMNNEHSEIVEVVYLTTQLKKELPTHVIINSANRQSIALCEQIHSVAVERVTNYMGECSDEEMKAIESALMIGLGIEKNFETQQIESKKDKIIQKMNKKVLDLKAKNKAYKSIIIEIIKERLE